MAKLDRRDFLVSGAGASLAVSAVSGFPASVRFRERQRRPNFIYIYTDDQRWDAVRAMGIQTWLKTPNMDRLMQGANFRNSFVTISLCAPSRTCTLTGLYPHRTGVFDNRVGIPDGTPVFAHLLRAGGLRRVTSVKSMYGTSGTKTAALITTQASPGRAPISTTVSM